MRNRLFSFLKRILPALGIGLVVFFVFSTLPPEIAHAQLNSEEFQDVGDATGLGNTNIVIIIARLIRAVLGVMGIVLTVYIVYAGWLYLTSQGDPAKTAKSKKIIQSAVIGLGIVLASFIITTFVLDALLRAFGISGGVSDTDAGHYSEPLSGSLGAGVIETHYPDRGAIDVPRNTRIMVTFKVPIDPSSIAVEADGTEYDADLDTIKYLNTNNVEIYPTEETDEDPLTTTAEVPLASTDVVVSFTDDLTTFVFDPSPLLGTPLNDTNYAVYLMPGILTAAGAEAFSGAYADGYLWEFEVSTEVDLTPPTVVSVTPNDGETYDRNIAVSIDFSEAMDPVAASGRYDQEPGADGTLPTGESYSYIEALADGQNVDGTFRLVNGYRTVEFITDDPCGEDPCGDTIYCLPELAEIGIEAHAAELGDEPPQALTIGGLFNGLADASGNSLDGDDDGVAEGPGADADDYGWGFSTTDEVNDDPPKILELLPSLDANEDISLDQNVEIIFGVATTDPDAVQLMQTSTLNSSNIQLIPDHAQELWFNVRTEQLDETFGELDDPEEPAYSKAVISHAEFWESIEGVDEPGTFYLYYPAIGNGVKSAYQICMYPSYGPTNAPEYAQCADPAGGRPYCCDGIPSADACETNSGILIP